MSVVIQCEGPGCNHSASEPEYSIAISNMQGRVVVGWLTVTGIYADVKHHFHNITCLSRWALDQRTEQEEN